MESYNLENGGRDADDHNVSLFLRKSVDETSTIPTTSKNLLGLF